MDLTETVEFFRYQLFSLTSIPPRSQHILGLAASVTLTDTLLLRQIGLTEGQRLIVKTRLTADTPITNAERTAAAAAANAQREATSTVASTPVVSPTTAAVATPAAPVASRPAASAASAATSAIADAAAVSMLQSCCSRSFFGTEAIPQPSVSVFDKPVCMTCAQTCHAPRSHTRRRRRTLKTSWSH